MPDDAMEMMRVDRSTPSDAIVRGAPGTFFGVPGVTGLDDLAVQVAFLGVPFDAGTPQPGNRTGQAAGPEAARRSSRDQFAYGVGASLGWHDVELGRDRLVGVTMADVGDVVIQGSQLRANFERMTEAVHRIARSGALPVAVGGDHSISFPLVRGMEPVGEIDVVYLDAHADFLDEVDGSRFSGASEMRRISELPHVRGVTALGIRNVDRAELDGMRLLGVRWATARELIEGREADVVAELVPQSPAIYVSIDLDVLDISLTPGHSLPEPGGLSYRQLHAVLDRIARQGRVVGFDVVELNPALDAGETTARTAAWLITHFLSEIFDARA
jgi:agmatinase